MFDLIAIWAAFSLVSPNRIAQSQEENAGERPSARTPTAQRPAEETRFSTALFREGLRKRGLTELLELHQKDFPPTDSWEVLMMERDVKLAEFADATRPIEERRAAIARANQLLEQLIAERPDDRRRFDWLLTLGHSLLYEEGDPFTTNLLYFEGSEDDRRALSAITPRAVAALRELVRGLSAEYQRIDSLSAQEFARIENSGLIEKLDRLEPSANYLLQWALFYDAIWRDEESGRATRLHEILATLHENSEFLKTPHERSRVQIPALVLAGMSARRLNDPRAARRYFDRAADAAGRLTDAEDAEAVQWAVALGAIESARAARDDERYDAALAEVARLRSLRATKGEENYAMRVAAAMLERTVLIARADAAARAGRANDARKDREAAWRTIASLAAEEPERRDVLYAALYKRMRDRAGADFTADPVETSAFIAGLLRDAEGDDREAARLLHQAVAVAERFLSEASGEWKAMIPEVLFNLAVAKYRLGDSAGAAERMLEVARYHLNFQDSAQAAVIAVQLSAALAVDAAPDSNAARLYLDALTTLVNKYPSSEAAKYWRFFLAQQLERSGREESAAAEYSGVDPRHELYVESAYGKLRSLASATRKACTERSADALTVQKFADDVNTAFRDFLALGGSSLGREPEASRRGAIGRMLCEARVLVAETSVLRGVDRPQSALDALADIESTFADADSLAARIWRVRLQAFEALGRLDEASQAVPAYVAADPQNAGPTLQSLYSSVADDAHRLLGLGDASGAKSRFDVALLLARQLVEWSDRAEVQITPLQRRSLHVQLAQASLEAGAAAAAREKFAELLPRADAAISSLDVTEVRVILGHSEALFRLGEHSEALSGFNRLATGLPPEHEIRWKALLRDLECRTALGHPPEGILKVIAQQRKLFPDLGGRDLSAEFDRIERENIRRRDGQP